MGEGGVSPEYFHRHMTFCEADDYLAGLHRRYHPGWEMARMQADVAAKCAGNKEGMEKMVFPWENETKHAPEVSDEERRQMEAEAREWERRMNEKRTHTRPHDPQDPPPHPSLYGGEQLPMSNK